MPRSLRRHRQRQRHAISAAAGRPLASRAGDALVRGQSAAHAVRTAAALYRLAAAARALVASQPRDLVRCAVAKGALTEASATVAMAKVPAAASSAMVEGFHRVHRAQRGSGASEANTEQSRARRRQVPASPGPRMASF